MPREQQTYHNKDNQNVGPHPEKSIDDAHQLKLIGSQLGSLVNHKVADVHTEQHKINRVERKDRSIDSEGLRPIGKPDQQAAK